MYRRVSIRLFGYLPPFLAIVASIVSIFRVNLIDAAYRAIVDATEPSMCWVRYHMRRLTYYLFAVDTV